jgi:hypothetical protein
MRGCRSHGLDRVRAVQMNAGLVGRNEDRAHVVNRRALAPQLIGRGSRFIRAVRGRGAIVGRKVLLADELSHRRHRTAGPAPKKDRKT